MRQPLMKRSSTSKMNMQPDGHECRRHENNADDGSPVMRYIVEFLAVTMYAPKTHAYPIKVAIPAPT